MGRGYSTRPQQDDLSEEILRIGCVVPESLPLYVQQTQVKQITATRKKRVRWVNGHQLGNTINYESPLSSSPYLLSLPRARQPKRRERTLWSTTGSVYTTDIGRGRIARLSGTVDADYFGVFGVCGHLFYRFLEHKFS